ncbi:hypothetical protein [Geothrix sp. PMB-07]|uniref:hypothetical protein n=1 Tax=Geothrix sp. PMB-07 TaxID=3068640 RepID=UPI002740D270|nr:hypothetical protein [Geothrix sp. PMB-07]WLT32964.1 hypothetical protein Q9293_06450 [Geothrix sp. PMB-07]
MVLLWLSQPGAQPPLGFLLIFIPLVFLGATWISNRLLGIPAMYRDWPADRTDPIERNVGWQQVEFGAFRGHCPMSIKFGQRCLHLKQPFPFQPFYWLGPASIPWSEVRLEKAPSDRWWAFLSAAEFRLGAGGRMIRLRGKAARALMERVKGAPGGQGPGHRPPVVSGTIRPR